MIKKYDCSKTLDYAHEITRLCEQRFDCGECVLEPFGICSCFKITPDQITTVQKWSDEHPDRLELTDKQKEVLRALKVLGYKYIAKDRNTCLRAYESKPFKNTVSWASHDKWLSRPPEMSCLSTFCSWSDPEPISISDLLEEDGEQE